MKILIAIGGREFSKPTLDLGMKIANSFKSSTTIAYVGKKISQFSEKDVSVVHQNLDDRELYRPGIRTLEWAYDFLISKKYIEETKSKCQLSTYHLITDNNQLSYEVKESEASEQRALKKARDALENDPFFKSQKNKGLAKKCLKNTTKDTIKIIIPLEKIDTSLGAMKILNIQLIYLNYLTKK